MQQFDYFGARFGRPLGGNLRACVATERVHQSLTRRVECFCVAMQRVL